MTTTTQQAGGDEYSDYVGREALVGGRWVLIEVADKDGAEVTDQDGGNHSVAWGDLDVIGVSP